MCTAGSCNYESCGLESSDTSRGIVVSDRVEAGCCVKCGAEEGIVQTRGNNGYCEACSLTMITHKFRATLGKSKIIRKDDSVLIGYSGKRNAAMLVHLIERGNREANVHKKLIFRSKLIYVDDGAAKGFTVEERRSACRYIADQCKSFGLETYAVSLNRSVDGWEGPGRSVLPIEEYRPGGQDEPGYTKLKGLFERLNDDTCRDELLRHLRRRVLVSAAKELACGKIFLADTSTELAVKVLADLSTGRGGQLGPDLGFCDVKYPDVMVLRPMREFTREDVEFYTRRYNLEPVLVGNENRWSSIRSISRAFVNGLATEFGGTVSTVFRTSEKLAGTKPGNSHDDRRGAEEARKCELCRSKIYEPDFSLSAVTATRFSRFVSSRGTACKRNGTENVGDVRVENVGDVRGENVGDVPDENVGDVPDENVGDVRDENVGDVPGENVENIRKRLCYGCALIFQPGSAIWTGDEIPDFLPKETQTEVELELMRQQLTDFLL